MAVKRLQEDGNIVMMVGDGITMHQRHTGRVGCAIGSGSDIAIESADIVLMKNDLTDVAKAVNLAYDHPKHQAESVFGHSSTI